MKDQEFDELDMVFDKESIDEQPIAKSRNLNQSPITTSSKVIPTCQTPSNREKSQVGMRY